MSEIYCFLSSILADMLSDAIGCVGFSWAAGPACTELETIVLDWLGRMIGLPETFLSGPPGSQGGGVIQTSASECVLDCLLAARTQAIKTLKAQAKDADDGPVEEVALLGRLMAYCSKEAHSCVEKGAMIGFVKLRILEPDENNELRGDILRAAMEEDRRNGLFPFFVCCTLGIYLLGLQMRSVIITDLYPHFLGPLTHLSPSTPEARSSSAGQFDTQVTSYG